MTNDLNPLRFPNGANIELDRTVSDVNFEFRRICFELPPYSFPPPIERCQTVTRGTPGMALKQCAFGKQKPSNAHWDDDPAAAQSRVTLDQGPIAVGLLRAYASPHIFLPGDCHEDGNRHVAGQGAMSVRYYKTGIASFAQIGAQSEAVILMFMTGDAPDKFRTGDKGWTAAVDGPVAPAKTGANSAFDTATTGKVGRLDIGCRRSTA